MIYVGIDEAGYGPMLGPLCVGVSIFRVGGEPGRLWDAEHQAPHLWRTLSTAVCRKPTDKRGRIAIADSKQLKLPNDYNAGAKGRHPLTHLERAVLALELALGREHAADAELLERLGARLEEHPWYAGPGAALPLANDARRLAIDANRLRSACARAEVQVLELACICICEHAFNGAVRRAGSKAAVTSGVVRRLIQRVRQRWPDEPALVACDRLGGRTQYAGLLERALHAPPEIVEESHALSSYRAANLRVHFQPEAETRHLPVALASMTAKLVRELAMIRFNAYWCARMPELKPTAGYTTDARRWLRDANGLLSHHEREAMVRLA